MLILGGSMFNFSKILVPLVLLNVSILAGCTSALKKR